MKKGGNVILIVCALALMIVIGIFIGRNMNNHFALLPMNNGESKNEMMSESGDYRLDINKATKVQLMELPGIGEVLAERIIKYRTENGAFLTTDDLLNVEGLGEQKLLDMEYMIKVGE